MDGPLVYRKILVRGSITIGVLAVVLIFSYVLVGHSLIQWAYATDSFVINQILPNRQQTPLQDYYMASDKAALAIGIYLLLAALLLLLLTNPVGLVLSGASFLIGTWVIFVMLDFFPALVKPLHFDMIPYFNYRLTYVPDPILGFRERPYNVSEIASFRGYAYSPLYGIDVPPKTLRWSTDGEGFRNPPGHSDADIVVIGSSFPEYGENLEDTYPMRLERKLGQKVVNLGKAGYGPFQYLKAFEQYGVRKKPKYVLFAFNVPGDVDLYLVDWIHGDDNVGLAKRSIAFGPFLARYWIALEQAGNILTSAIWTTLQVQFKAIVGSEFVHPEVAVLELPGSVITRMLFTNRCKPRSADELLRSPEWGLVEQLFATFKDMSERHRFVPVLVYIPAATEIYAQYSTAASGTGWQQARAACIQSSGSNEEAVRRLTAKLGIELVSLFPAYKAAASRGRLLYYPMDSHWNSEGREVAAEVTAKAVQNLIKQADSAQKPKTPAKTDKPAGGVKHVLLDDRNDSLMIRTVDGKISFWNSVAERLYGWKKDEAMGKVSHDLLQTQFPEPLEQINAKLIQNGHWQGNLVHATRDGRRVVVKSHWNLHKEAGAVNEINRLAG